MYLAVHPCSDCASYGYGADPDTNKSTCTQTRDAVQCGEIGEKLCKPTKRCVSNCSTCSSPDTKDPPPSEKLEEHYCRHYDCPSGSFLDVENHRCKNWTHCEINEYIKKKKLAFILRLLDPKVPTIKNIGINILSNDKKKTNKSSVLKAINKASSINSKLIKKPY